MNTTSTSPGLSATALARKEPSKPRARRPKAISRVSATFSYRDEAYDLVLDSDQPPKRSWLRGVAEFALISEGPLLLLGFRFGESGGWSLARFQWLDLPRAEQVPPHEVQQRALLAIANRPEPGDRLQPWRNLTLSMDFTRTLGDAIRERAKTPKNSMAESRAWEALSERFPDPEAMLARSLAMSAGIP